MLFPVFCGIAAVEGVIALMFMLKTPSMQKNSFLFGYSAMRISLAGLILAGVLFFIFVSIRTLVDRKLREKINQGIEKYFSTYERYLSTVLILISSIILPVLRSIFFQQRNLMNWLPQPRYFNDFYP